MKVKTAVVLSALLLVSVGIAQAGYLVRFKTGFEIPAVSVEQAGGMVTLTLPDGGVIGFPKWVIDVIETQQSVQPVGPGSGLNVLQQRLRKGEFRGPHMTPLGVQTLGMMSSAAGGDPRGPVLAQGSTDGITAQGATIGFSFGGPQQRWGTNPTGPVGEGGKIGTGLIQYRRELTGQATDPATGAPKKTGKVQLSEGPLKETR